MSKDKIRDMGANEEGEKTCTMSTKDHSENSVGHKLTKNRAYMN